MKKALFIPVLFFIGGASSSPESAWIEPAPVCDIQKSSFQAGESLSYKVFYNAGPMWVGAGEVYFKLNAHKENGREVLHAVSEAVTYKSFDWFFKVRDKLDTYMYANTLQSYKFSRDVNEGGYTFYRSYDWNRSTNTIVSFEDRKNGKTKTETIKNVDPCATDLLSVFYWARTIDFNKYKPGDKIPVSLAADDAVYDLYIRYEGKEEYKTKLGTFSCMKVKPLLVEGKIFRSGEGMTIWFTDDENRIPVRIESQLLVGRITCDLKSYSGIKYPFTSLVK
jgi:hypothetical protein